MDTFRFTATRFGATATRSFVTALNGVRTAHELCGGALPRTTVTNTMPPAPQAATRSTRAPGADRIVPPRTSAAYPCGYWRAGITISDAEPKPNGPVPSTRWRGSYPNVNWWLSGSNAQLSGLPAISRG